MPRKPWRRPPKEGLVPLAFVIFVGVMSYSWFVLNVYVQQDVLRAQQIEGHRTAGGS